MRQDTSREMRRSGGRLRGLLAAALAASGLAAALTAGTSGAGTAFGLGGVTALRAPRARWASPVARFASGTVTMPSLNEAMVFMTTQDQITGELDVSALPQEMGVYAVFDDNSNLQYIGLSRQIDKSIETHAKNIGVRDVGKLIASVRIAEMPGSSKEDLKATWESWIKEHMDKGGEIPVGNLPEGSPGADPRWRSRPSQARPPLNLAGVRGITSINEAVDAVRACVKTHPVVIFMKGTPAMPQCGFSARSVGILNQLGVPYESVNVLDDRANPGVRDGVKQYSKWPTIPQLFVDGELIGGADIIAEMFEKGELAKALKQAASGVAADNGMASSAVGSKVVPPGKVDLIKDPSRPTATALSSTLSEKFALHTLRIIDESAQHSGDSAVAEMGLTGESHFKIEIVAPEFAGLSPVQRQQKVFDAISAVMPRIHAMSLVTRTPEELVA